MFWKIVENSLPILTGGVGESSTMIGGEDVREFSTLEVAVAATLNGLKISGGVSVAIFDDVDVLADNNWGPIWGIGIAGGGVGSVGMALLTASWFHEKSNKNIDQTILKYSKNK